MHQRKTVIVADNSMINRAMLAGILCSNFDVIEAADGQEALDRLRDSDRPVSALLLDLMMPGKNGYEVLAEMKADPVLKDIPVIVVTAESTSDAEAELLGAGAADFISKPLAPEVVIRRVQSVVERGELEELRVQSAVAVQLQYQADHDQLTDIASRSAFLRDTATMLQTNMDREYVLVYWDIERFKLINQLLGTQEGDRLLIKCAQKMKELLAGRGTCCRLVADQFAFCVPADVVNFNRVVSQINDDLQSHVDEDGISFRIYVAVGAVRVDTPELHQTEVDALCDQATMAAISVKGRYDLHFSYYDDSMRQRMVSEADILDNMEVALSNKQFEVFLQPVYSALEEKPAAAEALVRWRRPDKGIVSPGDFIPLFERNGFIVRLDMYMFEHVCCILHDRAEHKLAPIPISVNLSRRSVYMANVVERIRSLVERYQVPHDMLRIEITESAYVVDSTQLIRTVTMLQHQGFIILMDDFGSGYSSFNTLKDLPVDILKIDMKFMENFQQGGRTGTILAAILHMAEWLGMAVVAEGVETREQFEYLRSIGCDYIQGYLFARPMPISEFEQHIQAHGHTGSGRQAPHFDISVANDVLGNGDLFRRVADDLVDGWAVYTFDTKTSNLEVLRANQGYFKLFGYRSMGEYKAGSREIKEHIVTEDRALFSRACQGAIDSGRKCNLLFHAVESSGKTIVLHAMISLLGRTSATTALIFIGLHLVSDNDVPGLSSTCPLAPGNEGRLLF